MRWLAVGATCVGCFGLKLAGMLLRAHGGPDGRLRRDIEMVPVTLLAALVAVQTFGSGHALVLDSRAAGVAAAAVAVWRRAPFVVVVVVAAGVTAGARAAGAR